MRNSLSRLARQRLHLSETAHQSIVNSFFAPINRALQTKSTPLAADGVIGLGPPVSTVQEANGKLKKPRASVHYFDTYSIVTRLEAAEFSHGQSVGIMNSIRALLVNGSEITKAEMLSKAEQENKTYLLKAANSELRAEIQTLRKTDAAILKAQTQALQRQLELLDQRMREDVQLMKTEVEMDVEIRKSTTRSEQKGMELSIQELNNKFTIKLGDLRTAMEKYKWDSTRRLLVAIVLATVLLTWRLTKSHEVPPTHDPPIVTEFFKDPTPLDATPNTFISLG